MASLATISRRTLVGASMLTLGALLLAAAGVYYGYVTFIAPRGSDLLTVEPSDSTRDSLGTDVAGASASTAALYPGSMLPVRQWADPRGSLDIPAANLAGFTPVSAYERPSSVGPVGVATHIKIPAIEVDAAVDEIEIAHLANAAAYQTPDSTVGHIPNTPNPGSHGNGWYFGHLESVVSGGGNVFTRLPRIAEMLVAGEEVHVILEAEGREYLYLVTQTDLVGADEIELYQAGDARVTLVTCYPRLRYDQRLLVTAQLIGERAASA